MDAYTKRMHNTLEEIKIMLGIEAFVEDSHEEILAKITELKKSDKALSDACYDINVETGGYGAREYYLKQVKL